jgi:hypothetical protein
MLPPLAEERHYKDADGKPLTHAQALKAAQAGQAVTVSVTKQGRSQHFLEAAFRVKTNDEAAALARILSDDFAATCWRMSLPGGVAVIATGSAWQGPIRDRLKQVLRYLDANARHNVPGHIRTSHERRTEAQVHNLARQWRSLGPLLGEHLAPLGLGRYAEDIGKAVQDPDARDRLFDLQCANAVWRVAQLQVQPALDASFTLSPARLPLAPREAFT